MLERNYFNFSHDKNIEATKHLLYRHYRTTRVDPLDSSNSADEYWHESLVRLANTPVVNSQQFGVKLVIALAHPAPSVFFRETANNGQLEIYFPELFNCIGCTQDKYFHNDDVFDHTMLALDRAELVNGFHANLDVKLAILFHDLGKFNTRKVTVIE